MGRAGVRSGGTANVPVAFRSSRTRFLRPNQQRHYPAAKDPTGTTDRIPSGPALLPGQYRMRNSMETGVFRKGWLAFELNILRRLKFGSVGLPFTGDSALGSYLKRWDVRVSANDLMQWAWAK